MICVNSQLQKDGWRPTFIWTTHSFHISNTAILLRWIQSRPAYPNLVFDDFLVACVHGQRRGRKSLSDAVMPYSHHPARPDPTRRTTRVASGRVVWMRRLLWTATTVLSRREFNSHRRRHATTLTVGRLFRLFQTVANSIRDEARQFCRVARRELGVTPFVIDLLDSLNRDSMIVTHCSWPESPTTASLLVNFWRRNDLKCFCLWPHEIAKDPQNLF